MFEVEPLPVDGPQWTVPNRFVPPPTAGGRQDQDESIVKHFLSNRAAFQSVAPLLDEVV